MENLLYDETTGQILTGSFQNYCMPRADQFCDFEVASNPTVTEKNPLGVKGGGEAATIAAIPAGMNAANDALARIGAAPVEAPATPEKLGRAIRSSPPALRK
jgi:carbon-monoxide dehydrogenase large subunit